jgi:hypothetical protein
MLGTQHSDSRVVFEPCSSSSAAKEPIADKGNLASYCAFSTASWRISPTTRSKNARTHTAAWANPTRQRLRFARCCDGHLAGQLGVEMFSQLLSKEWLHPAGDGYLFTAQGAAGLGAIGFAVDGWTSPLHSPAWPTAAWTGLSGGTTWRASCPMHC